MNNNDIRNLLALTAEQLIGKSRFELGYHCEETCAEGVKNVLNIVAGQCGNDGLDVGSVSCNTMYANMTASPYWYEPDDYMIRGDIIFFDWDRISEPKPLDHVGIVLSIKENIVTYANINGSSHDTWTIQTISKTSCNISYWLRYLNPPPETNLPITEDIYNMIHRLQELILDLDSTTQQIFDISCKINKFSS